MKLYLHFHKTYNHWIWKSADFKEEVQNANAYVVTKFLFVFVLDDFLIWPGQVLTKNSLSSEAVVHTCLFQGKKLL